MDTKKTESNEDNSHKNLKLIYLVYYVIVCFLHSIKDPTASLSESLVAGLFIVVWSLFAGGVICLAVIPFLSSFIKFPKSVNELFIDNVEYAVPLVGFLFLLYILLIR